MSSRPTTFGTVANPFRKVHAFLGRIGLLLGRSDRTEQAWRLEAEAALSEAEQVIAQLVREQRHMRDRLFEVCVTNRELKFAVRELDNGRPSSGTVSAVIDVAAAAIHNYKLLLPLMEDILDDGGGNRGNPCFDQLMAMAETIKEGLKVPLGEDE